MKTLNVIISLFLLVLVISGCGAEADNGTEHRIKWTGSSNADGYRLYCGANPGAYTFNINIGGGDTSEVALVPLSLPDGVYYCAMTAYNFDSESTFSNEITFATKNGDLVSPPAVPVGLCI